LERSIQIAIAVLILKKTIKSNFFSEIK